MAISNYTDMLNAYSTGYITSNTAGYANQRQQYASDTWINMYQNEAAYYPMQQLVGLGAPLGMQAAPAPAPAKPESNLAWLNRRVKEMQVFL